VASYPSDVSLQQQPDIGAAPVSFDLRDRDKAAYWSAKIAGSVALKALEMALSGAATVVIVLALIGFGRLTTPRLVAAGGLN
jgi:hypothetical protein